MDNGVVPPPTIGDISKTDYCVVVEKEEIHSKKADQKHDDSALPLPAPQAKTIDEKLRLDLPPFIPEEELLGSVTTSSSPAVRTSARVIQKMKMDLIRPASPPISEKRGRSNHLFCCQKLTNSSPLFRNNA